MALFNRPVPSFGNVRVKAAQQRQSMPIVADMQSQDGSMSYTPYQQDGMQQPGLPVAGLFANALPSSGLGASVAGALPYAAAVGGGIKVGRDLKKYADGGELSKVSQAALALPTGGLSLFANRLNRGKNKDQKGRDVIRKSLQEGGVIDDKFNLSLADGSMYDIGQDGSTKGYNVDFSKEGIGDVVGMVQGLASVLTRGGSEKAKDDLTGYLTNAATSKGDAKENLKTFVSKAGFDQGLLNDYISAMERVGTVDSDKAAAYRNGVNSLFAAPPPAKSEKGKLVTKGMTSQK
jgi:hypothetical protein